MILKSLSGSPTPVCYCSPTGIVTPRGMLGVETYSPWDHPPEAANAGGIHVDHRLAETFADRAITRNHLVLSPIAVFKGSKSGFLHWRCPLLQLLVAGREWAWSQRRF